MYITCVNCKNTWAVPSAKMLAARLRYGLGYQEYAFPCPECGAKNVFTDAEFQASDHPQIVIPLTGSQPQAETQGEGQRSRAKMPGGSAPTNPVEGPGPGTRQRQAIVLVRGLQARLDHSDWAEIVGGFSKGEKITILDTWTDGEHTWAQLGPERWINIEQDAEPVIELLDD